MIGACDQGRAVLYSSVVSEHIYKNELRNEYNRSEEPNNRKRCWSSQIMNMS
jgi:hypothetical protein